jgi:hypothetical protein
MARGLTIWVEVVNGGVTGSVPVIHCRHALVNPREVDLVAAWGRAKLRSDPKASTRPKSTVDVVTEAGNVWSLEKGVGVFGGLWWLWSGARQVGALVGDNTPHEQLVEVAELLNERCELLENLRREKR